MSGLDLEANDKFAQKGKYQTSIAEVSGQSSLEVTFPCWNFFLQVVKPLMPILPLSSSL